ncbi:MAG: acyl-[acyl-carrier-protein] thioesterase [Roseburia sp. 40_7]|nr:MAG: acyl-[acyl-carrier-protein] thioesterase [Roseburia sp. 40_7]
MFRFDSVVRYSEIDADRYMTLPAILDILQDCCTFHSEHLEMGIDYLKERERAWVLSAWQVVIDRYPKMGEKISAYTWPYEFKGFMGNRNFKIEDEAGNVIVYANSVWVYINTATGRPVRVPQEVAEAYQLEPPFEMETADRKIPLPDAMEEKEQIRAGRFCIDTNQHVNNSKYVMMAEEYLPEDFKVRELRVEYKKAAVLGDVIYPKVKIKDHQAVVALENEQGKPYAVVQFMEDKV